MFLIYGANGYTGELIAREAVRRGHKPILAGRNAEKLGALAKELDSNRARSRSIEPAGDRLHDCGVRRPDKIPRSPSGEWEGQLAAGRPG